MIPTSPPHARATTPLWPSGSPPPQGQPTPAEANAHWLRTRAGQARYAKRTATVATVFGILKPVQGFRQCLLRGLRAVPGEWALVVWGGISSALLRLKDDKEG